MAFQKLLPQFKSRQRINCAHWNHSQTHQTVSAFTLLCSCFWWWSEVRGIFNPLVIYLVIYIYIYIARRQLQLRIGLKGWGERWQRGGDRPAAPDQVQLGADRWIGGRLQPAQIPASGSEEEDGRETEAFQNSGRSEHTSAEVKLQLRRDDGEITNVSKCLLCSSGENVVSEQEDETEARVAGSAPSACLGHATAAAALSAPRLEWTAPRPSPAAAAAPQCAPAG